MGARNPIYHVDMIIFYMEDDKIRRKLLVLARSRRGTARYSSHSHPSAAASP